MRVVVLHSRYLSGPVSGENRVVEEEVALLRDAGVDVTAFCPEPVVGGVLDRARAAADAIWSARAARAVRDLVRARRADVVHVHNLFPTLSPAVIRAAHAAGAAVVMTLHNYRLMCLPAVLFRDGRPCTDCVGRAPLPGVVHRCYRGSAAGSATLATALVAHRAAGTWDRVALFLAISDYVRAMHVQAGLPTSRIAVKANFARPAPRREGAGEGFLFLGRLAPEKGILELAEAWDPGAPELVVAGDGPLEAAVRARAGSNVRFAGAVPAEDVPRMIARARAVVVPSVCAEGAGQVVLEAFASGVPVIASDAGALPEIVEHGRNGLVVPPGDGAALRAAATSLADDAASARLGEGAFATWNARFRPERALEDLLSAYRRAREERPARTS